MPDYSKGKIYKIVCNVTGLVYIGSTCEPTLARRLVGHRSMYTQVLNGTGNKLSSFEVLENNNFDIILIESVDCISKDELHARERYFIESIVCVNKLIPIRTKQEKKEHNKEYKKEYHFKNREFINENRKEYFNDNKDRKRLYDKARRLQKKEAKIALHNI